MTTLTIDETGLRFAKTSIGVNISSTTTTRLMHRVDRLRSQVLRTTAEPISSFVDDDIGVILADYVMTMGEGEDRLNATAGDLYRMRDEGLVWCVELVLEHGITLRLTPRALLDGGRYAHVMIEGPTDETVPWAKNETSIRMRFLIHELCSDESTSLDENM